MSDIIRFESFLRLPNFFYRSVGINMWGTYDGLPQQAFFYFSMVNVNIWLLSEVIFSMLTFGEDFVQATMTLSYAGFVLVGSIKLFYMWRKKENLTRFLTLMNSIFPQTEQQQQTMELCRHLRQSSIIMSIFSLTYMILIWTYNLYPWAQRQLYDCWLHARSIGKSLPYESYVPWDWHENWTFYLLYASQSLSGYQSAAGQIASDLVLYAMATQMVMHYEHVARKIADYQPKWGRCGQRHVDALMSRRQSFQVDSQWKIKNDAYLQDMRFLSDLIAYHSKVLSLSDIMNEVFGVPLLVNFIASSFVICFVGFQITMDSELDYKIKLLWFFLSSLTQMYLICHYGQLLLDASVNVAQAVFNNDWTIAHTHYQQMLVVVAARAQKPALLKATSFVHISRGTMTEVIQISYKFFTLIRTMYSN